MNIQIKKIFIVRYEQIDAYELLLCYYNLDDKLYPLIRYYKIDVLDDLDALKIIAKRKYPDLYDFQTIMNNPFVQYR